MKLGDIVAWLTSRLGIHPTDRCGCEQRRQWLNRNTWPLVYLLILMVGVVIVGC